MYTRPQLDWRSVALTVKMGRRPGLAVNAREKQPGNPCRSGGASSERENPQTEGGGMIEKKRTDSGNEV